MQLSKRLEACLQYTEGFNHLADVGTDHAMLPIEAVLRGYVMDAIAIDNKFGPYLQGRNNIQKHDLGGRVKVSLGDGIEKITNDTDVVVISGMGGEVIRNILTSHSLQNVKRLILQPNRDCKVVRQTIVELNYAIVDELVLQENKKYYDIIVVERGQTHYSELELEYGPINLIQKPYYFMERIKQEYKRDNHLLEQVTSDERKNELLQAIQDKEEILNERN